MGGDDAAKFQIDASSGALSFVTAPNFESPADLDHNNSYLVQIRASDGSLSDDQVITVQVGDITEVLHWIQSVDAGTHPDPNPNAHTIVRGLGGLLAPGWLPSGIGRLQQRHDQRFGLVPSGYQWHRHLEAVQWTVGRKR